MPDERAATAYEYRCHAEVRKVTRTEMRQAYYPVGSTLMPASYPVTVTENQYEEICGMEQTGRPATSYETQSHAELTTGQRVYARWDLIAAPATCAPDPGAHDHVEAIYYAPRTVSASAR
jgi:hypothetical protein